MDCGVILHNVVKQPLSLGLLLTVALASKALCVTECAKHEILEGDVGGNVTFRCTEKTRKTLGMMYLQRGAEFVNGFFVSKEIGKTWQNTRLDQTEAAVHMSNLNVFHEGNYTCYFESNDTEDTACVQIILRINATYSKPSISVECSADCCLLGCRSHGGYPSAELRCNIPSKYSHLLKIVNSSEERSQDTQLFNASITAVFNCSEAAELSVNCSVGDSVSDPLTICAAKDPPLDNNNGKIALYCAAAAAAAVVGALVYRRRKKSRQPRRSAEDQQKNTNNVNGEGIPLTDVSSTS